MRVVGLVVGFEPRKTQGKPQENAPKKSNTEATPKKTDNK